MKCKNCGFEIGEGKKFCTNCGTKVETDKIEEKRVSETVVNSEAKIKVKWYYSAWFIILVSTAGVFFIPIAIASIILLILRFRSMKGRKKSILNKIANGVLIFWVAVNIIGNPNLFTSDTESQETIQTDETVEEISLQDNSNAFPTKTEACTIFTATYPKKFSKERQELLEFMKEFDGSNIEELNVIPVDFVRGKTYIRTI